MNIRTIALLCLCSLLFGCVTTQQKAEESPEAVKQLLGDEKHVKNGDWIRATTLDDRIHELSFRGLVGDDLHGGDTVIPLSQIKKLEIFPLLRREGVDTGIRTLVGEQEFRRLVAGPPRIQESTGSNLVSDLGHLLFHHKTDPWRTLILDNGDRASMKSPKLEKGMLVGTSPAGYHDGAQIQPVTRKIPFDSVVGFKDCNEDRLCTHIERWNDAENARLEEIQEGNLLHPGDWVRLSLSGGKVQEFQYRELAGRQLVGGDGEAAVADIEGIEIYPTAAIAPTKGQAAAGGIVGAVALVGWVLLLMSGIPVPPPMLP